MRLATVVEGLENRPRSWNVRMCYTWGVVLLIEYHPQIFDYAVFWGGLPIASDVDGLFKLRDMAFAR